MEVCPYCRTGFEAEDEVTRCPSCGTAHHADCFAENGGCTIFGCPAAPAEEAKISVAPGDFQQGQVLPVAQPVASPPPPPMPGGSSMPPPPLVAQPPCAQGGQYYPYGYGYGSYVQPKSRVAFVLLAVFLGSFGAHNFYAGYNKKAVVQLCITICTCFAASIVTWIWAIVEACVVNKDDDGVLLS
jgi:TM2 domain-containing membrane protein YozV